MTFRGNVFKVAVIAALVGMSLVWGCTFFNEQKPTFTKWIGAVAADDGSVSMVMPVQDSKAECDAMQADVVKSGKEYQNGKFQFSVTPCVRLDYLHVE